MLQFSCRFALLSTFRLWNWTPEITRILTLYQAQMRQLWRGATFFDHIPKLIIFDAHNLQTFKHNTLIVNAVLLVCITGSDKNYASHCSKLAQLHQQPVDAVLRPTFVRKLCYKLLSVVTFTFIQTLGQNFVFFTERHHVNRQCDVSFLVKGGVLGRGWYRSKERWWL